MGPSPTDEPEGLLDPFEVYEHGETLLRRHLEGLAASHLRHIANAHHMVDDATLDHCTKEELVHAIVIQTRRRGVCQPNPCPGRQPTSAST